MGEIGRYPTLTTQEILRTLHKSCSVQCVTSIMQIHVVHVLLCCLWFDTGPCCYYPYHSGLLYWHWRLVLSLWCCEIARKAVGDWITGIRYELTLLKHSDTKQICMHIWWVIMHFTCSGKVRIRGIITKLQFDGLVQDCSISSALAMEILQSCTKPSISLVCSEIQFRSDVTLPSCRLKSPYNSTFSATFFFLTANKGNNNLHKRRFSWWRHQMKTFSALLAICAGNSPVPGEFPTQRPVTRSFDVYFDLRPNKRLSKQSWGWWFETLSCSLWRHRNVYSRLML